MSNLNIFLSSHFSIWNIAVIFSWYFWKFVIRSRSWNGMPFLLCRKRTISYKGQRLCSAFFSVFNGLLIWWVDLLKAWIAYFFKLFQKSQPYCFEKYSSTFSQPWYQNQMCWQWCTKEKTEQEKDVQLMIPQQIRSGLRMRFRPLLL